MVEPSRSQRFAEWMLSLAMPLDRAQAMLGDLEEDRYSSLKFWSRILGMVAAFTGRGIAKDGLRIALWSIVWWGVLAIILFKWWVLVFRIMHGWNLPPHNGDSELIAIAWKDPLGELPLLWGGWVLLVGLRPWGRPLVICVVAGTVWISLCRLTGVLTNNLFPGGLWMLLLLIGKLQRRAGEPEREIAEPESHA